jgi:hypothetical protein
LDNCLMLYPLILTFSRARRNALFLDPQRN